MYREPDRCVITDDGVRLAARVVNDVDDPDLTVVFVHGFSLRMSSWYFQRTALAPTWGERTRLVFYDHRGHGRSDAAPPQTMTMSQLGDDLALVLRALAPTGPVVVGHSMGGMATMALARRHPALFAPGGRVVGVGLVATAARGITEAGVGEGLQNPVINAFRLAVRRAPWFIQAGRTCPPRTGAGPARGQFRARLLSPATARAVERMIRQTPLETIVRIPPRPGGARRVGCAPGAGDGAQRRRVRRRGLHDAVPELVLAVRVAGEKCRLTIIQGPVTWSPWSARPRSTRSWTG